MTKMPFCRAYRVSSPMPTQTQRNVRQENQAIKWIVTKLNKQIKNVKNTNEHFDPVLVRGVVSRVQTALPSIRIRLWNLRLGFHPIYRRESM